MRLLLGVLLALSAFAGARAAQPCTARPGSGELVIEATVLTPTGLLPRGQVRIEPDGTIGCVGRACMAPGAARIRCPRALLSPGFINGHEHLAFNHIAPTPDDGVRYGQRHDWRKGLRGFPGKETFTANRDPDVLAWSELRHLLSGTTSIIGESMAPGLTRNLDSQVGLEGLPVARATYAVFPLDDLPGIQRDGDCDYGPHPADAASVGALHAYVAHVAEGRDALARNEFACLSSDRFDTTPAAGGGGISHDVMLPNVAVIHGVALTAPMFKTMAERHVSLIWSPRSNLSLYGKTTDIAAARAAGVTLALGTDWLPSGSATMPREAACALAYSREHLDGLITPKDLWRMMTVDAARAVHADAAVGAIAPGQAADLILVRPHAADPYRSLVSARPQDLLLIMRGGQRLSGLPALMPNEAGCEDADLAGAKRRLCIAAEAGKSYASLSAEMADRQIWPAVFDNGVPPVEPTCETRS